MKDNCSRKFYHATVNVSITLTEISNPEFEENRIVEFWDCAGLEKFKGIDEGHYINALYRICILSKPFC